jgi:hypothetical protein
MTRIDHSNDSIDNMERCHENNAKDQELYHKHCTEACRANGTDL